VVLQENYTKYDGFVILHGTDTMAYTASALSFMLENLGKPVILTGSQVQQQRQQVAFSFLDVCSQFKIYQFASVNLADKRSSGVSPLLAFHYLFSLPGMPVWRAIYFANVFLYF